MFFRNPILRKSCPSQTCSRQASNASFSLEVQSYQFFHHLCTFVNLKLFHWFQAERLADYGRLMGGSQPHLGGRGRDLDRIQDLFPYDNLGLHGQDPASNHSSVSLETSSSNHNFDRPV